MAISGLAIKTFHSGQIVPEETLGERLRQAKKERRVSNAQIAEAAGVTIVTVSRWLNDKTKPGPEDLDRAAAFLGVSSDRLRYGDIVLHAPDGKARVILDATPRTGAPPREEPASFSQRQRAFVNRFLAELSEAGVTEEEEGWARRLLLNPDNYGLNMGGNTPTIDEEAVMRDMEGMSLGVRAILRARGHTGLAPK